MPLHINDEDLCPTTLEPNIPFRITERPRSEFTALSYTVHALELAVMARRFIDLRSPLPQEQRQAEAHESRKLRDHLTDKYETFVAGLPSYFRLGSTVGLTSIGSMAAIPVHRKYRLSKGPEPYALIRIVVGWMLHQQIWSLFLRLHRGSLSSQSGRSTCQLLAQNIISTQAHIQARCAICGSLSTSGTQCFNAAIVLLIDLLMSPQHKDRDGSSSRLCRLMTRDKIRETIELLRAQSGTETSPLLQDPQSQRAKASTHRSIVALEALMNLEEGEFGNDKETNGADADNGAARSLKFKVIDILEALQQYSKTTVTATEQAGSNSISASDMSTPVPTATDVFPDLNVLPLLSNDPSSNIWQTFDFDFPEAPIENGFFSKHQ